VVIHAARLIAIAGHSGNVQPVISGLGSEHQGAKLAAIEAASRLKILTPDRLYALLTDPDAMIRVATLDVLVRQQPQTDTRPPDRIVSTVVSLLDDPECAEAAAAAIGELGPASTAVVDTLKSMALHHDDPLCREAAVASLGSLGRGQSAVIESLNDIAAIRRRATVALSNFDGPDVDLALARAAQDRDAQVRQLAEDLLGGA